MAEEKIDNVNQDVLASVSYITGQLRSSRPTAGDLEDFIKILQKTIQHNVMLRQELQDARQSLGMYQMQLQWAEGEIKRANETVAVLEQRANEADERCAKARDTARKLLIERDVKSAKEQGFREGWEAGQRTAMEMSDTVEYARDGSGSSGNSAPRSFSDTSRSRPAPRHSLSDPQKSIPQRAGTATSNHTNIPHIEPFLQRQPRTNPSPGPSIAPTLPPDNYIPFTDSVNGYIGLPPPHELHVTAEGGTARRDDGERRSSSRPPPSHRGRAMSDASTNISRFESVRPPSGEYAINGRRMRSLSRSSDRSRHPPAPPEEPLPFERPRERRSSISVSRSGYPRSTTPANEPSRSRPKTPVTPPSYNPAPEVHHSRPQTPASAVGTAFSEPPRPPLAPPSAPRRPSLLAAARAFPVLDDQDARGRHQPPPPPPQAQPRSSTPRGPGMARSHPATRAETPGIVAPRPATPTRRATTPAAQDSPSGRKTPTASSPSRVKSPVTWIRQKLYRSYSGPVGIQVEPPSLPGTESTRGSLPPDQHFLSPDYAQHAGLPSDGIAQHRSPSPTLDRIPDNVQGVLHEGEGLPPGFLPFTMGAPLDRPISMFGSASSSGSN